MMSLFAFYWRGDEYDLSSWQGWVMLLIGLVAWTMVSARARSISENYKAGEADSDDRPPE